MGIKTVKNFLNPIYHMINYIDLDNRGLSDAKFVVKGCASILLGGLESVLYGSLLGGVSVAVFGGDSKKIIIGSAVGAVAGVGAWATKGIQLGIMENENPKKYKQYLAKIKYKTKLK